MGILQWLKNNDAHNKTSDTITIKRTLGNNPEVYAIVIGLGIKKIVLNGENRFDSFPDVHLCTGLTVNTVVNVDKYETLTNDRIELTLPFSVVDYKRQYKDFMPGNYIVYIRFT